MKHLCGLLLIVATILSTGCDSGTTSVETYKPAPGQVSNPSAPPAQAGAPRSMEEAIQSNPNMPPAAKDALLRGKR